MADVELAITTQNLFTQGVSVGVGDVASISVSGTFSATVTLQRKLNGTDWRDVATFTAPAETSYDGDEAGEIRIGIKTGEFSSGTATCRIGKG